VSPSLIAVLFVVAFGTSIIGVITGGNSLVNVPVMIWCGMQPREAIATNMFACVFMTLSATVRFHREGLVRHKLALPLCAITLVTSVIGAQLTVVLSEAAVKTTVGASLVVMLIFMAARPRFGDTQSAPTPTRQALGYLACAVLGVYGGMYSGGYTTLLTFACVTAFGMPLLSAVGLTKLINLVSCAAATALFFSARVVDLRVGIPLCVAMLGGGWVGAHLAIRRGEKFVRVTFLIMVGVLAVKLLIIDTLRH